MLSIRAVSKMAGMLKKTIFVLLAFGLCVGTAQAACPPAAPGDTAAEIQANSQRLVCLQNELAAETRQRNLQFQLDALQKSQQDLRLQRRLDALPPIPVYQPPVFPAAPGT